MNKKKLTITLTISVIVLGSYFMYMKSKELNIIKSINEVRVETRNAAENTQSSDQIIPTSTNDAQQSKTPITTSAEPHENAPTGVQNKNIIAKVLRSVDQPQVGLFEVKDISARGGLGIIKIDATSCTANLNIGALYIITVHDSQEGFYNCISAQKIDIPPGQQ